jgi:hypothetical protein
MEPDPLPPVAPSPPPLAPPPLVTDPIVTNINPAAEPGENIAIIGRNFGLDKDQVAVTFNALANSFAALVLSVTDTRIHVVVPLATHAGDAQIVVTVGERSSRPALIRILPPSPIITAVGPAVALRGSQIVVFGSHFGSDPSLLSVQFCRDYDPYGYGYGGSLDCHTASVLGLSDTRLTVHVPRSLPADRWELVITVTDARLPATANVQVL